MATVLDVAAVTELSILVLMHLNCVAPVLVDSLTYTHLLTCKNQKLNLKIIEMV